MTDTDYTPEQLAALKLFKPALHQVLTNEDVKPYVCFQCPYATSEGKGNYLIADEGRYHCALLDLSGIGGNNPPCKVEDWLTRARLEAMPAVNEARIWRDICKELYVKFVAAVYAGDENETVGQIKERLLGEESPQIRTAFEVFLKSKK